MILAATVFTECDPELMYKSFSSESKKNKRSEYTIKKKKNGVGFCIEAQDSTALRATLNSITKLITVYEKVME